MFIRQNEKETLSSNSHWASWQDCAKFSILKNKLKTIDLFHDIVIFCFFCKKVMLISLLQKI